MKKFILAFFTVLTVVAFSLSMTDLKVSSPANVVGQPYILRAFVTPGSQEGTYSLGLEGHLELFGINVSVGTFTGYPDFSFNNEVYAGFGIRLGGLYAAVSAIADNCSIISGLSSFRDPQVAFGIVGFKRTGILFHSWSRFDLSYLPIDFIVKDENGNFKITDNFDWTNARMRLVVESQDVGYFLFGFYTGPIYKLMNGNYEYAFELAIPSDPIYIYVSQDFDGSWKVGLGLVLSFLNGIGTYDLSTGNINWVVKAQF